MECKRIFFNINAEMAISLLILFSFIFLLAFSDFGGANTVVCENQQMVFVEPVHVEQPRPPLPPMELVHQYYYEVKLDDKLQNTRQFADFTSHKEFLQHYKSKEDCTVPPRNDDFVTTTEVFIFVSLVVIGLLIEAYYL